VDQNQVAFVAELGEERGLDCAVGAFTLQTIQQFESLGGNLFAFVLRAGAPGLPVEAEELVEQERAFKRKWDGEEVGHGMISLNTPSW
jgi:hypothetical protein